MNHSAASRSRAAFTLLEMAIVIAIVGLVAGAIVAGSSYIRNAELTTMMANAKTYINAFGQFQQRYAALPGDMPTASTTWSGGLNGDGNGRVRAPANTIEVFYVFQHLSLAGFIDGGYTGATTGGGGTFYAKGGVNVPRSPINGVALMFDHPDATDGNVSSDSLYFDGLYGHVLRIAGLSEAATSLPATVFLTPEQALKVDSKFDDGKPGTGWVVTPKFSALGNCSTSNTTSSSVYNVSYSSEACYLFLRMQ